MPETVQVHAVDARATVLAGIPVTDHRMDIEGTDTAVLVGGDGPPLVLLPGPGESALFWARILPTAVQTHRVIAPDLPGTSASGPMPGGIDADRVISWLHALITRTCEEPPVLVGHVVGGALAIRYAQAHPDNVRQLVLVDTLGLRRFLPAPAFGFRLMRLLADPTPERFGPFLDQCMVDAPGLKRGFGDRWQAFADDYLAGIQDPEKKAAMGELIKHFGAKKMDGLDNIAVPTTLIWGRHDKATPLRVAQAASRRHGWPLYVIDDSGDDPKIEQPQAFMAALEEALA